MLRMIFYEQAQLQPISKSNYYIYFNLSFILNYKFKMLRLWEMLYGLHFLIVLLLLFRISFIYVKLLKLCKEAISLLGNIFLDRIHICITQRNLVLYTKVNGCKYMRIRLYTMIIMTKIIR